MRRSLSCLFLLVPLLLPACAETESLESETSEATLATSAGTQLSAGGHHACVVLRDGGVRCWGNNTFGQLGNGTISSSSSPVTVPLTGRAVSVSAGYDHTCAVIDDGTVQCWGANYDWQLGDSSVGASRNTPATVPGLTNVRSIASSSGGTCALHGDGRVSCWGAGDDGLLGNGVEAFRSLPVGVITASGAPLTGVEQLVAGVVHNCAIASSGVYCWGTNAQFQINVSQPPLEFHHAHQVTTAAARGWAAQSDKNWMLVDETAYLYPSIDSVPLSRTLVSVTGGHFHSCGLAANGNAYCWGANTRGELGGTPAANGVATVQYSNREIAIDAGRNFSCSLRYDGSVRCWGDNGFGQLGDGTMTSRQLPAPVIGLGATGAWGITVGGSNIPSLATHACSWRGDGTMRCVGANQEGQLGNGSLTTTLTPVTTGIVADAIEVTGGGNHTCAVTAGGFAYCWGDNANNQLGDGTSVDRTTPTVVRNAGAMVSASAGMLHTCALRGAGRVACWGWNHRGQLGRGTITSSGGAYLLDVSNLTDVVAIDAGFHHTCAVKDTGEVWCWGENTNGGLGDGTTVTRSTPVRVTGLTGAVGVASGSNFTCALLATGLVRCWGGNGFGQLGDGTQTNRMSPVTVGNLTSAVAIAAGAEHVCALTAAGETKCWGRGSMGQLGTGTTTTRTTATPLSGGGRFMDLAAAQNGTCGIRADGTVACWGHLGTGTVSRSTSFPTDIAGF